MIDRVTLVARPQVQRRAAVVAELSTSWIAVVAEGAQLVAKIRGTRGEGPVRLAWRAHAWNFKLPQGFHVGVDGSAPALPR